MGASRGAISTVSGVAMTPPRAGRRARRLAAGEEAPAPARRGSLTQGRRLVDATPVRPNRTPPSYVSDTRPPSGTSSRQGSSGMAAATTNGAPTPSFGGQEIMFVDYVLLHIVIALGVMALAAHTANS